jgi:hypothetical protein
MPKEVSMLKSSVLSRTDAVGGKLALTPTLFHKRFSSACTASHFGSPARTPKKDQNAGTNLETPVSKAILTASLRLSYSAPV